MGYSRRCWACPYFRWDEKKAVHCDCGKITFPDRQSITEYADRYCGSAKNWSRCTLAQSQTRYIERKDKEHEQKAEKAHPQPSEQPDPRE